MQRGAAVPPGWLSGRQSNRSKKHAPRRHAMEEEEEKEEADARVSLVDLGRCVIGFTF